MDTIWDLEVTADDIAKAFKRDGYLHNTCPIAQALMRETGEAYVNVGLWSWHTGTKHGRLESSARALVRDFDGYHNDPVEPCTVRLTVLTI